MRDRFTIWDAGVYALVLVAAICLFAIGGTFGNRTEGDTAVVTYGDNVLRLPLDSDTQEVIISEGFALTIVVKNGSISVVEAECPDHTCIKMGARNRTGDFICCVPSGVYIKIEGGGSGVDFIAG